MSKENKVIDKDYPTTWEDLFGPKPKEPIQLSFNFCEEMPPINLINSPTKREFDPNGKTPNEPGSKLDAGKSAMFQGLLAYFPRACESVASVSTFGATKYTWKGWESVPNGFERYSDALVRHLAKEGTGEIQDQDSNLLHAAHVAWNSLARLELLLKEQE